MPPQRSQCAAVPAAADAEADGAEVAGLVCVTKVVGLALVAVMVISWVHADEVGAATAVELGLEADRLRAGALLELWTGATVALETGAAADEVGFTAELDGAAAAELDAGFTTELAADVATCCCVDETTEAALEVVFGAAELAADEALVVAAPPLAAPHVMTSGPGAT